MALANVIYTADGTVQDYTITFDYLTRDDVEVYVNNVLTSDAASLYSATFQDDTTVRVVAISDSSPVPSGAIVKVQRNTPTDSAAVVFADGAVVRATALNKNTDQLLFIAQEVKDESSSRIALDNSGNFDATGNRIINVGDPVADTDAVNKRFISTNLPNINTVAGIAADVTTTAGIASDVTAVAGNNTDISTVAPIAANVTTVAGVATSVPTVAGIAADVTAVAGNNTDISTVAGINANVTTVAGITSNIAAVVADQADIGVVAGISTDVQAVGPIAANVTTTAGIASDVTAVAGNATDISAVAAIDANVTTVAGISADVTTVAADGTDIGAVAAISSDVQAVGPIAADVTTVAGISADVTAAANASTNIGIVAAQVAAVQSVANDLQETTSEIDTVANSIANVDLVGGDITNVNTVATNLTAVNSFANSYVVSATAPTSPVEGMLWFDTANDTMKVYGDSGFANAGSSVNGVDQSVQYTATAGQTTFAATYDAGYVHVYVNGVKLDGSDFTATNGTSVVLTDPAAANDVVDIVAFGTFALANFSIDDANDVSVTGGSQNDLLVLDASSNVTTTATPTVTSLTLGSWVFTEGAGGELVISTGGADKAKLDTSGNLTVVGNVTAYGTI